MKRNVKNNLLLILTLSFTGVAVLVLLVLIGMEHSDLTKTRKELAVQIGEINNLNSKEIAPMEENLQPMEQDLKFYQELQKNFIYKFGTPLQPAKGKFLSTLLTKEGKTLTEEQFVGMFRNGWEAGRRWDMVEKDKAKREIYVIEFKKNFKNWDAAAEAFRKEAAVRTTEPLKEIDVVILRYFGITQPMDAAKINEFSAYSAEALQFAFGAKFKISEEASSFGFPAGTAINEADAALVPFHWDVIGDMVKRMAEVPILELNRFSIRSLHVEKTGNFRRYHYTFTILGTMKMVRDLTGKLDQAYTDNRFYLVQSVFLYAHRDETDELIHPAQPKDAADAQTTVRGSAGRQKEQMEGTAADDKKKEESRKPKAEGSVMIGADDCVYAVFDVEYVVWAE